MHVVCPICRAKQSEIIWKEQSFPVLLCNECDCVFAENRNVNVNGIYNYKYLMDSYIRYSGVRTNRFKEELGGIADILPPGRLLDVGCGVGLFLKVAKEVGWSVYGIEPSSAARSIAEREVGKNTVVPSFEHIESGESFNLITFWDSLAHVPNPVEMLYNSRSRMDNNGLLVIKTPNMPRVVFYLAKMLNYFHESFAKSLLHPSTMLFYYTPDNLASLLYKVGFDVVKIKKCNEIKKRLDRTTGLKKFFGAVATLALKRIQRYLVGFESFIVYARKR